ncbi:MAG: ribonuclease H-like domain-containing protein [Chloroflexi bacterium]|nr:ribonuclease H-like domain-containing protein [Chloroflexota bacterium]
MSDIFFDLETQNSIDDVGGRAYLDKLRVSVAVALDADTGEFKAYTEADVSALIADLRAATRVIGFNIKRFDYPVLKFYTRERLNDLSTVDMLEDIYNTLGFRVSLDALAHATLGAEKTADGLQAIRWFREGKLSELLEYCKADVALTRQLFEFGRTRGYLKFLDRSGRNKQVDVEWK